MAWGMVGESGRSRNTKLLITGCCEHNTTQSEFVKLATVAKGNPTSNYGEAHLRPLGVQESFHFGTLFSPG